MKWQCPTHGELKERELKPIKARVIKTKNAGREFWEMSLNCPDCSQEVQELKDQPTE